MSAPEPRAWRAGDVVVGAFVDGEQVRGMVVGTDPERLHVAWVDGHEERLPDAERVAELRVLRVIDRPVASPEFGTRVHVEAVVADLLTAGAPGHVGLVLDPGQCVALAGFLQDLCDMHDEQAIDLALWPTAGAFARRYLFELDENGAPL